MGSPDDGSGAVHRTMQRLASLVGAWDGVEVLVYQQTGVQFRVSHREIGHVHASGTADLPFPVRIRRDLVAAGRAEAHHTLPLTGWVSVRLRTDHDVPRAVELFRLNYERLRGASLRLAILPVSSRTVMLGDRTADDLPA